MKVTILIDDENTGTKVQVSNSDVDNLEHALNLMRSAWTSSGWQTSHIVRGENPDIT